MALAYVGDDAPVIDVPASVEEPETSVEPELLHEQPPSPVLHPQTTKKQPKYTYTLPTTVHASSTARAGFPWWLVVVLLIAADGKNRKR